jgi:hypothetical protein
MNANPVGTWVNNPRHDDPLGIEPVITGYAYVLTGY